MKIKEYYDYPTMVSFRQYYEDGEVERIYGIAYMDFIICACCGGRFNIAELIADEEDGDDLGFEELDWVSFNEYIR